AVAGPETRLAEAALRPRVLAQRAPLGARRAGAGQQQACHREHALHRRDHSRNLPRDEAPVLRGVPGSVYGRAATFRVADGYLRGAWSRRVGLVEAQARAVSPSKRVEGEAAPRGRSRRNVAQDARLIGATKGLILKGPSQTFPCFRRTEASMGAPS